MRLVISELKIVAGTSDFFLMRQYLRNVLHKEALLRLLLTTNTPGVYLLHSPYVYNFYHSVAIGWRCSFIPVKKINFKVYDTPRVYIF